MYFRIHINMCFIIYIYTHLLPQNEWTISVVPSSRFSSRSKSKRGFEIQHSGSPPKRAKTTSTVSIEYIYLQSVYKYSFSGSQASTLGLGVSSPAQAEEGPETWSPTRLPWRFCHAHSSGRFLEASACIRMYWVYNNYSIDMHWPSQIIYVYVYIYIYIVAFVGGLKATTLWENQGWLRKFSTVADSRPFCRTISTPKIEANNSAPGLLRKTITSILMIIYINIYIYMITYLQLYIYMFKSLNH